MLYISSIGWIATLTVAVRVDNVLDEGISFTNLTTAPRDSCAVDRCASVGGGYEVRGISAGRLSQWLHPQTRYFVGTACDKAPGKDAEASVVQWLDGKDPVNNSSIAIYVNPLLETTFRGKVIKLCTTEKTCLCELSGKASGAFDSLLAVLPATLAEKYLAMQLHCPSSRILDLLGVVVLFLLLLVLIVTCHAWLRAWRVHSQGPVQKSSDSALELVRTSMQNFASSYSWAVGFIMSLAALQMGSLAAVRKSTQMEAAVWFVASFPVILAALGAMRLMNLLCKQQLAHACLQHCCVLTKPLSSSLLDVALLTMMTGYMVLVLFLVSSSFSELVLALVGLAGSAWALIKAIQTARDFEKKLQLLEVNSEKLAKSETPDLKLVPWQCLLSAGRSGAGDLVDFIKEPKQSEAADSMRLTDILWQNRALFELTGSRAGFLTLPSSVALVAMSFFISALHITSYACSCGELSSLQMASSLHSLEFSMYQDKYEVMIDSSFRTVAVVASAHGPTTQWINFTQPSAEPSEQHLINESFSSATAEIHLLPHRTPRVAHVHVKGLRPSLDPKEYKVRFSSFLTVPTAVEIEAPAFYRTVVWSTLPGSTISVPEGDNFSVRVILADFFLNLPLPPETDARSALWTRFQPELGANDTTCSLHCQHSLDCFDYFVTESGCLFVWGNHTDTTAKADTPWSSELSAKGVRKLTARLSGCASATGECSASDADAADGSVSFNVRPDWRGQDATMTFELVLEVGGQTFTAEAGIIQLHKGYPIPNDAIGVLLVNSAEGTKTMEPNITTDLLGNVIVNVSHYDPFKVSNVTLVVMPVLPDPAFTAVRETVLSGAETQGVGLQGTARCRKSPMLQYRYEACGATHGRPDRPFPVSIDPWTGRVEEGAHFSVFSEANRQEARVEMLDIIIFFGGHDSPSAWAVEEHGPLLLSDESIKRKVLSSGDATCLLLQSGNRTAQETMCRLINEESLGHMVYSGPFLVRDEPQLLSEPGVVRVMGCLRGVGCAMESPWLYNAESHLLEMNHKKATVSVASLLKQIGTMPKEQGLAVLNGIEVSDPTAYYKALARASWQLTDLQRVPQVVKILAVWRPDNMSEPLLQELVKSRRMDLEVLLSMDLRSTAEAFGTVKKISFSLEDAEQLGLVAVALQLLTGLKALEVGCHACFDKRPTPKQWRQMSLGLSKLTDLTMKDFALTQFPSALFPSNNSMKRLDLAENQLVLLPPELPETLKTLENLDLSRNNIAQLPGNAFDHLEQLQELSLYSNELAQVPENVFDRLEQLQKLSLYKNKMAQLPEKVFDHLEHLQSLDLGYNELAQLPENVFDHLTQLQTLSLSGNKVEQLPGNAFHNLEQLHTLSLERNKLAQLQQNLFDRLEQLKKLSLQKNELARLPQNAFDHLEQLQTLYLHSNKLALLPDNVLDHLAKLQELTLCNSDLQRLPENQSNALKKFQNLKLIC